MGKYTELAGQLRRVQSDVRRSFEAVERDREMEMDYIMHLVDDRIADCVSAMLRALAAPLLQCSPLVHPV